MATDRDDTDFEPPHTSSSTDHVLAELQLFGHRPFQDGPDARPLPEANAIGGAVAGTPWPLLRRPAFAHSRSPLHADETDPDTGLLLPLDVSSTSILGGLRRLIQLRIPKTTGIGYSQRRAWWEGQPSTLYGHLPP
jgi:hypothetical protein